MKRRKALAAIGIALIMLVFSGVSAVFLINMAQDLHKTHHTLKTDKEKQYGNIVLLSAMNGFESLSGTLIPATNTALVLPSTLITELNGQQISRSYNATYTVADSGSPASIVAVDVHHIDAKGIEIFESIMFFREP